MKFYCLKERSCVFFLSICSPAFCWCNTDISHQTRCLLCVGGWDFYISVHGPRSNQQDYSPNGVMTLVILFQMANSKKERVSVSLGMRRDSIQVYIAKNGFWNILCVKAEWIEGSYWVKTNFWASFNPRNSSHVSFYVAMIETDIHFVELHLLKYNTMWPLDSETTLRRNTLADFQLFACYYNYCPKQISQIGGFIIA
jgi:hypothetical protein